MSSTDALSYDNRISAGEAFLLHLKSGRSSLLCREKKQQNFREEQTGAPLWKPELPQMLLEKAKNRAAMVCLKWFNQTPCGKISLWESRKSKRRMLQKLIWKSKPSPVNWILVKSKVPYLYEPAAGTVSVSPGSAGVAAEWQVEPACSEATGRTGFCSTAGALVVWADCWTGDPSWPEATEGGAT